MYHLKQLRVLYLTHHGPWPTTSGGRLRDAALIQEVAKLVDLEVWAVSRTPEVDHVGLRRASVDVPVRVFPNSAAARSFPTRDSSAARIALRERLDLGTSVDVIHVEGHYLLHLLPERVHQQAVVVEHNVESHLLRQRATHRGVTPELAADIAEVSRAEERVWASAGLVVTLSEEDRKRILDRVPGISVAVSTDGADHLPLRAATAMDRDPSPRFGFLANYAYPPNADALGWLLDEIFPELRRLLPCARLVLAGSGLDQALAGRRLPAGVRALGWQADLSAFWDDIDVLLCPLRIGGGVKVKLLEALRSGVLIISTSVGLEGLPGAARAAIARADSVAQITETAVRLNADAALRQAQRERLAHAQRVLPTWRTVAGELHSHWLGVTGSMSGGVVGA